MPIELTRNSARKVLKVVRKGLCHGSGRAEPGHMCVEQAVAFALGLPFNDEPDCVHPVVRTFKISLNDSAWSSNEARAKGLERIAIAQLGSNSIDGVIFVKELTRLTVKKLLPVALRIAAEIHQQKHKDALEKAARDCEAIESFDAASAASVASYAASDAARAARAASDAARAARAASAASYAASVASYAASDAASYAASYAASAARAASYAASYAASAARAASDAASYAASAARAASDAASAASDKMLCLMAEIGVEALQICNSPGCQWLDLCNVED